MKKNGNEKFESPIIFRQCWQADAQKTLINVVKQFNDAGLKKGDEIFIHGEKDGNSIRFYDLNLINKPTSINTSRGVKYYNNSYTFYENLPRHYTSFRATDTGLKVEPIDVYYGRVCPE